MKKYDKILDGKTLKEWTERVEGFEFASTAEINGLIDVISEFVSRDKLLEWQHGEMMEKLQEQDNIMPAVKPLPLAVAVLLFTPISLLPTLAVLRRSWHANNPPSCQFFDLCFARDRNKPTGLVRNAAMSSLIPSLSLSLECALSMFSVAVALSI